MNDEEREKIMSEWRTKFWALIEEHNIEPCCVYNADQTGLYYQKLPNRMYVDANQKSSYAGVKQMKDKTRVTLMVCTSAAADKCPLAIVGKPKQPRCFNLCINKKPPLPYINQSNAWFNQSITLWWIHNVYLALAC